MKILYLSQYFPPEMGAPAARVSEIARAWAELGHDVTVATGLPNHPTGIVPREYRGRLFFREQKDGYEVLRFWLYATPNRGFLKRSLNFVSFLTSAVTLGALLTRRPDAVVATSPQLLVGVAGLVLARLKRVPFVFEVRDLWPQTAIDLGVIRHPALTSSLTRLERWLYRSARLVIVVSEEFIGHIEKAGVPRERIVFVPNGVDVDGALANAQPAPEAARPVPGVVTVSYVGTHGMCQGLSTIVNVAEQLREDPSIRFLFVGEGAEKELVKQKATHLGLDNCVFLDAVPREQVASIYRDSDICLVPLIDRPVFRTVLPSKIFEIMAFRKPIILSTGGRAERLVSDAGAGICAPPEDVKEITSAIRRLRDTPSLRDELGVSGEIYVREHFDRRALARRYVAALEEASS
jgi:colanic acid biosynthesis glycosyl transferase WcaI